MSDTRSVLEEKAKRRAFLRNEFLKKSNDPFRHATQEGGTVFDAAFYRFQAQRVSAYEHFRPTLKNARYGMFSLVLPLWGFTWLVYKDRSAKEDKIRNGEVAYRDRSFKHS